MEIDATREYAAAANSGRTRWEVTGRGGFAGLREVLQKGAVVRAESDALIVKGPGVTLASEMGNLFQSMARSMLTNESFFLQLGSAPSWTTARSCWAARQGTSSCSRWAAGGPSTC